MEQTETTIVTVSPRALARPRGAGATAIVPRVGVRIREGTLADLPFIDRLQKAHARELGFLPRMALAGKIRLGQVLIAEDAKGDRGKAKASETASASFAFSPSPLASPLGYLIAADRYFKRDEVGYITQINVVPEFRRSLVAAALLQAQFDRSAYGCRLYCCWCAQDLAANAFWEAMGFAPIAFRTGSRTKGRRHEVTKARRHEGAGAGTGAAAAPSDTSCLRDSVPPCLSPRIHIFWQKRIRPDDASTPWWYPSQTGGGELREDRIVFPIPPGMSWRDVLPVVLPEVLPEGAQAGGSGADAAGEAGAPLFVHQQIFVSAGSG